MSQKAGLKHLDAGVKSKLQQTARSGSHAVARLTSATRDHATRASIFPTKCPGNSTRQWNDQRACRRNFVRAYTPPHACTLEQRPPVSRRPPKPVFPYEARMSSSCMQQNPVRWSYRSIPLGRRQAHRELCYVASSASSAKPRGEARRVASNIAKLPELMLRFLQSWRQSRSAATSSIDNSTANTRLLPYQRLH